MCRFVPTTRLVKKGSVFLNGHQSPLLPLSSAISSSSTLCKVLPRPNHSRGVLVGDQDRVLASEDRPRIASPTSVLCGSIPFPLSKHTSNEHQLSSLRPYNYHREPQTTLNATVYSHFPSDNLAKSFLPSGYVAKHASDKLDNHSSDYSYLLCSHNIDEFGADVAYGKEGSVTSYSVEKSTKQKEEPDFSFIDDIYESVKAEILSERACSSAQMAIAGGPKVVSFEEPVTPIITLTVDQPVTIVGENGKEYKVVLQAVEEKATVYSRRKLVKTSQTPKPRRAPGIALANMTIEEINKRKREQNRAAAQRYRQKQKYVKDADKEEQDRLERRNIYLRTEASRLQREIECLRKKILGSLAKR